VAHGFRDGRLTDVDPQFQQFAMNPRCTPRGFACAIARINVRMCTGTLGRPRRCRLLHVHHSRNPCRCQAMTVSGLTITSRSPLRPDAREHAQRNRSVLKSRNRAGRVRCNTCSWCRNATISSWSTARERKHVRRVRRTHRITEHCREACPSSATTSTVATRTDFSSGTGERQGRGGGYAALLLRSERAHVVMARRSAQDACKGGAPSPASHRACERLAEQVAVELKARYFCTMMRVAILAFVLASSVKCTVTRASFAVARPAASFCAPEISVVSV
jgi:hypothetical protein